MSITHTTTRVGKTLRELAEWYEQHPDAVDCVVKIKNILARFDYGELAFGVTGEVRRSKGRHSPGGRHLPDDQCARRRRRSRENVLSARSSACMKSEPQHPARDAGACSCGWRTETGKSTLRRGDPALDSEIAEGVVHVVDRKEDEALP